MSVHEEVKFSCNQCNSKFSSKGGVKLHKMSIHDRVRYSCDQCDSIFTLKISLKTHRQFVHEGFNYKCNECDYKSSANFYLRRHQMLVHEVSDKQIIEFKCDQCVMKFRRKCNLMNHVKFVHEGFKLHEIRDKIVIHQDKSPPHKQPPQKTIYECDQCEMKSTNRGSLIKHKISMHETER